MSFSALLTLSSKDCNQEVKAGDIKTIQKLTQGGENQIISVLCDFWVWASAP